MDQIRRADQAVKVWRAGMAQGHWQSAGSGGLPVRDTADWQSALHRSADW